MYVNVVSDGKPIINAALGMWFLAFQPGEWDGRSVPR